jgi:hypothetical protein
MMKRAALMTMALALMAGTAWAKLPAPPPMTDEQKVMAEAAKAKTAENAKKAADLLGKYQDKAVDNYSKGQGKVKGAAASAPAKPGK